MSEQQEQDFSEIIDTGLEDILSGKMTLEEVLKQHPEQAELIQPQLETAMWLHSRRNTVAPRPGFVAASRRRVVERIKEEASSRGTKRALFGFLWPPRFAYSAAARTAVALVVVVMLLLASGGVVSASQNTIPGDGLYSVKRLTEQVTYQVTADPAQRVTLSINFSGRRLEEAKALFARGDTTRAQAALLEYQQNIDLAMAELERIPAAQKNEVSEAAELVQNTLTGQADLLLGLKQSAPASASTVLDTAILAANNGITSASAIYNDVNGILPTPTTKPTKEPSQTATDQPTTAPTDVDASTDSPGDESSEDATPAPGSTTSSGAGGAKASPTPTADPKTIHTPKPTNENRQPKPAVTPGKNENPKSNPPNPPNPPKPPKTDNPSISPGDNAASSPSDNSGSSPSDNSGKKK